MLEKKINQAIAIGFGVAILGLASFLLSDDTQRNPSRPGSKFSIPEDELAKVITSAESGNLPAIRRLIYYFEQYEGNLEKAKYWSKRAREQGDEKEIRLYASELLNQARYYAESAQRRREILSEAITMAEHLVSINNTPENRDLVQQIKAEQSR